MAASQLSPIAEKEKLPPPFKGNYVFNLTAIWRMNRIFLKTIDRRRTKGSVYITFVSYINFCFVLFFSLFVSLFFPPHFFAFVVM